ncbi:MULTISPECIES: NfeD family protein [Rickettsieae]|uniref:NfeD family protein n=1 Tax=Rickettsieae TaxID=33988 RepID=UPI0020246479|nr:NfeD family protein [Rickettsia endosymbiont of Oedothorax gibbosus]MDN3029833.1 NfeD family protein [Candidatus Tisiphia sp.]
MTIFNISIVEWWLIAGIICIIIEFSNIPNVGFLFLGLGGISNAIILNNYSDLLKYQYIIFGFISFLWLVILWYPLKFYVGKKHDKYEYSDMLGQEVQLYSNELLIGEKGQVLWSGTIMNAKLSKDSVKSAYKGDTLRIVQIDGNVLICTAENLKK